MNSEVKNDYIEKALNELITQIGVKEFTDEDRLVYLIEYKKVKEAIKEIALYLGLPIEVKISYVPKGYRPTSNDGFSSTHLVKTDNYNRGVGGITAQVSIPSNLPFYGTPSMVNFPINVKLSENCAENPKTLISIMAHELSHIVLNSMWHKEKENEFYTDLTAMILGFAKIMKTGRKVVKTTQVLNTIHTETTTYGYLSDDNFKYAFDKIKSILKKQKSEVRSLKRDADRFSLKLNKAKKCSKYFNKYLEYLGKNPSNKISQEDGQKISSFYQHDYMGNFQSFIHNNDSLVKDVLKYSEDLKIYSDRSIETVKKYKRQIESSVLELNKQKLLIKKDVDLLGKYIGFLGKIKLHFK